jgi:hypothetical protein
MGIVVKNKWFCFITIFLFFTFVLCSLFSRSERFYSVDDGFSQNMLERLQFALKDILSNKNFVFEGYLKPLNNKNYINDIVIREGKESYTENKKYIYLCMRNRKGELYKFNTLIYVLLHEISHVINNELHHTKKFFLIFSQLLSHAEQLGYYNRAIPFEFNYCS